MENDMKPKPEDVFYKNMHFIKPEMEMTEYYLKGFKLKSQKEIFREILKIQDTPADFSVSKEYFFIYFN